MITDSRAIKFTNETIRPMAEKMRAFKAEVDAAAITWADISSLFPNDPAEILNDGRESEGVTRLSGEDIVKLVAQIAAIKVSFDVAGVAQTISKPCVRPLRAE